jgi:hypothetical protein
MFIEKITAFLKGDASVNIGDSELEVSAPSFLVDLSQMDREEIDTLCYQLHQQMWDFTRLLWGEDADIQIHLRNSDGSVIVWNPTKQ